MPSNAFEQYTVPSCTSANASKAFNDSVRLLVKCMNHSWLHGIPTTFDSGACAAVNADHATSTKA